MKQKTWVEISKNALQANVGEIKKIIGEDVLLLAIIKGNAYGAGITPIVSATKSLVDWYGVDTLDEANLARVNCDNPILILGYVATNDAAEVVKKKFSVLVYTYELAVVLSKNATRKNPAKIHIKVDTGLVRLGLWPEESIILAKKYLASPILLLKACILILQNLLTKTTTKFI